MVGRYNSQMMKLKPKRFFQFYKAVRDKEKALEEQAVSYGAPQEFQKENEFYADQVGL